MFAKKYWLPLALSLCGLIFFIYGLISLQSSSLKANQPEFEKQNVSNQAFSQVPQSLITIEIEGAVVKLGVYSSNSASSQDLDSPTRSGSCDSAKIINSRPYSSVNDLLSKKIVSGKVFGQIKNKTSIYQMEKRLLIFSFFCLLLFA